MTRKIFSAFLFAVVASAAPIEVRQITIKQQPRIGAEVVEGSNEEVLLDNCVRSFNPNVPVQLLILEQNTTQPLSSTSYQIHEYPTRNCEGPSTSVTEYEDPHVINSRPKWCSFYMEQSSTDVPFPMTFLKKDGDITGGTINVTDTSKCYELCDSVQWTGYAQRALTTGSQTLTIYHSPGCDDTAGSKSGVSRETDLVQISLGRASTKSFRIHAK